MFCFMNVHLPFDGHNMCLEEALEELDNLLAAFDSKRLKMKVDKNKVVWVLGGDLNDDMIGETKLIHSTLSNSSFQDCKSNFTCLTMLT